MTNHAKSSFYHAMLWNVVQISLWISLLKHIQIVLKMCYPTGASRPSKVLGCGGCKILCLVGYLLQGGWSQQGADYQDQLRACPRTSWVKKINRSASWPSRGTTGASFRPRGYPQRPEFTFVGVNGHYKANDETSDFTKVPRTRFVHHKCLFEAIDLP